MNKKKFHVSFQKLGLTLHLIGAMVLGVTIGGLAEAEPLPKEAVLPLALAQQAAAVGLAKCEEGGYKVSVAVADRGGNLKVLNSQTKCNTLLRCCHGTLLHSSHP